MPLALWTLLRLNFRGVLRRMVRGFRTPRGFVFLLLGILVIVSWLGPMLYRAVKMPAAASANGPHGSRRLPFLAFVWAIWSLPLARTPSPLPPRKLIFFSPARSPAARCWDSRSSRPRLGTVFTSLIFVVVMLRYSSSWLACFVGIWLTIQFMQLFAMAVVMVGQTVGERIYSAARRGVLIGVAAVAIVAAAPKLAAGLRSRADGTHAPGSCHCRRARVARPVRRICAAPSRPKSFFPIWLDGRLLALLIDLLMVSIVIGLDANYLETAATVSQRRYERRAAPPAAAGWA